MASPMPLAPAVTSTRNPLSSRSMIAPNVSLKISAGKTAARKNNLRRAADVTGNASPPRGFVAPGNRLAYFGVKADRVAFRQPLGIGAQIEIDHGSRLEPKRADDLHQNRRMRRFIDREVKRLVEFDGARQVRLLRQAPRPHLLFRARDRLQIVVGTVLGRLRGRMALDRDP